MLAVSVEVEVVAVTVAVVVEVVMVVVLVVLVVAFEVLIVESVPLVELIVDDEDKLVVTSVVFLVTEVFCASANVG